MWHDLIYFSTNATIDPSQSPVLENTLYGPVPAGSGYWQTNVLRLPATQDGQYELSLLVDGWNEVLESQTNNNRIVVPITLHILPPDLAPLTIQRAQYHYLTAQTNSANRLCGDKQRTWSR